MNRSEGVPVTIPLQVWGRLASEADTRGVKVEDLLVAAINHIISPADRAGVVVALARAGYPDGAIAGWTGELRQYVAATRRAAGISAGKKDQGMNRMQRRTA